MRTWISPPALFFFLLQAAAWAGPAPAAEAFRIAAPSEVEFEVHARKFFTREVIIGKNQGIKGSFLVAATPDGAVSATVEIDAAGFKTGIAERDEHVAGSLKAKQRAWMTFELQSLEGLDAAAIAGKGTTLTAKGVFTIGDYGAPLAFPVWAEKESGDWHVSGEAKSGFKALHVTPPGIPVLVGVQDGIILRIRLVAKK